MGGSSGSVSSGIIAPTNSFVQQQKDTDASVNSFPGSIAGIRSAMGQVTEVHPEKAKLVKAVDIYDGSPIADGGWIELDHSPQEIAEKWGTVKVGFRIRTLYTGSNGEGCSGTITGTLEDSVQSVKVANTAARGLFAIFAPGIGIG